MFRKEEWTTSSWIVHILGKGPMSIGEIRGEMKKMSHGFYASPEREVAETLDALVRQGIVIQGFTGRFSLKSPVGTREG